MAPRQSTVSACVAMCQNLVFQWFLMVSRLISWWAAGDHRPVFLAVWCKCSKLVLPMVFKGFRRGREACFFLPFDASAPVVLIYRHVICTFIHPNIYTYIHSYVHSYINSYIHSYINSYIQLPIHTSIHISIQISTHISNNISNIYQFIYQFVYPFIYKYVHS